MLLVSSAEQSPVTSVATLVSKQYSGKITVLAQELTHRITGTRVLTKWVCKNVQPALIGKGFKAVKIVEILETIRKISKTVVSLNLQVHSFLCDCSIKMPASKLHIQYTVL
jgi:hypothetical protein